MHVRDGLIVNNPSDSAMTEIKRSKLWDAPKRRALTIPQQKAFINYLESDREYEGWLPIITVLLVKYISEEQKEEKLLTNQQVIKTPIVRNGKQATVGYAPEVWKGWG